jgi:hypothetical protein
MGLVFAFLLLVQPFQALPERCATAEVNFSGGKPAALTWQIAAQFPQPSRHESEHDTFRVSCEEFSAEQAGAVFTIRGASLSAIAKRLIDVRVLSKAGYIYPALELEPYGGWISVALSDNTVSFEPGPKASGLVYFNNAVVTFRVNNGVLQPVLFEGRLTPVMRFGSTDVVDVMVKQVRSFDGKDDYSDVKIARISINAKERTVAFYGPPIRW